MPAYLDYNATAPQRFEVIARMQALQVEPLNPSSVHAYGREAKKHLEQSRKTIADIIAAWPNEIIFTASGTEANAMALRGFSGRRVLVSAIEHSSVLKARNDVTPIPVDARGIVDMAALDALLSESTTPALVSVMLANNETGVIQPIREVAELCKKHNALLHCDAVQGVGKIPVDFGVLQADMMTISAHKCSGPLGAAALVLRRDLAIAPLITGGGQETGRRSGTENVAAIAGFAVAMECATNREHMRGLRQWLDVMELEMQALGGVVFGTKAPRLPNTTCVAMSSVSNEVQLMDFDLKGFAVSAGSACSSGRIERSYVLTAMGVDKDIVGSAIRVSAGWQTTQNDIIMFTECWKQTHSRLNKAPK